MYVKPNLPSTLKIAIKGEYAGIRTGGHQYFKFPYPKTVGKFQTNFIK